MFQETLPYVHEFPRNITKITKTPKPWTSKGVPPGSLRSFHTWATKNKSKATQWAAFHRNFMFQFHPPWPSIFETLRCFAFSWGSSVTTLECQRNPQKDPVSAIFNFSFLAPAYSSRFWACHQQSLVSALSRMQGHSLPWESPQDLEWPLAQ